MTLIREMFERPLDPGYASAARRRAAAGGSQSSALRSPLLVVAALLTGLLFGIAAVTLGQEAPSERTTKSLLINQIEQRRDTTEQRSRQIADLQREIRGAEAAAAGVRTDPDLEASTGAVPVEGPGMVVTLDNAPQEQQQPGGVDPREGGDPSQGVVLSRDLQIVVNSLWEAGAEAVAVNGQRLSTRSAIRFAGEAILVNFRPLNPPYVINAIGDPDRMPTDFVAGSGGTYLATLKNNFGIQVKTETSTRLDLPGATLLTVREAKPGLAPAKKPTQSPTDQETTS